MKLGTITAAILRPSRRPIPGEGQKLALLLAMAGTMATIVALEHSAPGSIGAARYLAILPVAVAAYSRHGIAAALAVVGFFIVTFVPGVVRSYGTAGFQQAVADLVVFAFITTLFAYLCATIAIAFRTQRSLAGAVREQEELLDRASDLFQVTDFVIEEGRRVTDAESAVLLLRSPIDERWEAIDAETRVPISPALHHTEHSQSVAVWLLSNGQPQIMNNLEGDPRLVSPDDPEGQTLRSLLTQPIRAEDGTLAALLVLVNSESGYFAREDLNGLAALIAGAEKALKQAGLYARTGEALARRARQLGALQRAAQELNTTLDQEWIVGETLNCALEISGGEAGAAGAEMEGLTPSYRTAGVAVEDGIVHDVVHAAFALERAVFGPQAEGMPPSLLPDAHSRLVVPIRRDDRNYGAIAVESARDEAFDGQDLLGLATLAGHAATALENTRLLADVRRERQKSDLIVETMADGLLTVGMDGRVVSVNPAAQALLGERAAAPAGEELCIVLGCSRGPACRETCRLLQAIAQPQVYREDQWTIPGPAGGERVLELSAVPLPALEGAGGGLVIQLRDVTARAELDRFQRELIATFSHELRTPLTNINTIVGILSQDNGTPRAELSREYLETLQKQTRRLSEFAERILDVSRLDTGRWRLEARPLPVVLIVEDRIREWQTLAPARALRVELPEKRGWIWADEHAVSTVLDNLIDNAVKYAPADSDILVCVTDGSSGFWTISVQDHGPGVPPEQRAMIFERFTRGDGSDSQDVYGHGLGLYIARKLVEAMGGRIWVESGPTDGSVFSFTLPVPQVRINPSQPLVGGRDGGMMP
jgi:two-component system phosphate regulon sensor histidine kinase PhoR